jgi:hypothetical protein
MSDYIDQSFCASVSITSTALTTKFLLLIFTVMCLWIFVFHVAGCFFHSVGILLAVISYSYVINTHNAGSRLWGGGGADGTHNNRAQTTRGCSDHSYKLSLELRFQNVFCMNQITSYKEDGLYLVYNLLLRLLFLCVRQLGRWRT